MADLIVAGVGVAAGTPFDTLDILTLDEAKRALNIAPSDTSADTELAQVVTAASRFVDKVGNAIDGVAVKRAVTEDLFPTRPTSPLILSYHPATALTVTEYVSGTGTALTASDGLATAGEYLLDGGMLHRRSSWSAAAWRGGVQVQYTAGLYDTTASVAAHYKEAAVAVLIHLWQHRGANSGAGTFGGDGAPFGGVPFSTKTLRDKVAVTLNPDPSPVIA